MATKFYSTLALVCAFSTSTQAADLSGEVNIAMLQKAVAVREPVEIASPGGNMAFSMLIASVFKERGLSVRVTGLCASGCAMIAIGSGNCTVAKAGRLVLHAPVIPAGANVTAFASARDQADRQWLSWMAERRVPSDLLNATLTAFGRTYELSEYAMKRVGCRPE